MATSKPITISWIPVKEAKHDFPTKGRVCDFSKHLLLTDEKLGVLAGIAIRYTHDHNGYKKGDVIYSTLGDVTLKNVTAYAKLPGAYKPEPEPEKEK
jgi:hypothetical protein